MLSKTNPESIEALDHRRNNIVSKKGGWLLGKGVFSHGYRLLDDLVINSSYMQIVILNATGKMVSRELADWMAAGYGCMSWPDPRIWCNQIGALAGATLTSASAATFAGTLAGDSRIYGQGTLVRGMNFIRAARDKQIQGETVSGITEAEVRANRGKPNIMGFARPLAQGDERVAVLEQLTEKLSFSKGPHLRLAYDIEAELYRKFGESMNIVGYVSSFLADHSFTAKEVSRVYAASVMSGVTACYAEYADRPANDFLPLRCDDIDYEGLATRTVASARTGANKIDIISET